MPKPTLVHKIPLTLLVDGDTVDLDCDIPGIIVKKPPSQLCLSHRRQPESNHHRYCYTIDTPPPTKESMRYIAVFWGPNPEALTPWPSPQGSVWTSSAFEIGEQESHCITVVVLHEPRMGAARGINAPRDTIAQPKASAGRRHVKSDFQGGDDEA